MPVSKRQRIACWELDDITACYIHETLSSISVMQNVKGWGGPRIPELRQSSSFSRMLRVTLAVSFSAAGIRSLVLIKEGGSVLWHKGEYSQAGMSSESQPRTVS